MFAKTPLYFWGSLHWNKKVNGTLKYNKDKLEAL